MLKEFANTKSLKDKRLKQLYLTISRTGPISKSDLIMQTGLTSTTCSRLIDLLLNKKMISESGVGESSGGRKPLLYEINSTSSYLIGVDISRTYTKILLLDLNLVIISEARLSMNYKTTPNATINFIIEKTYLMIEDQGIKLSDVLGIGIGTIGPLDRKLGIILNPFQFPSAGWVDVPIKEILSKRLGIKTLIDLGVNTAAIAEYHHSFLNIYKNMIYIIKGVGSRTGVIMDGRLMPGLDKVGIHGQGHMIVEIHGRKCICGAYGCVQAYSSIDSIKMEVISSLKLKRTSILSEKFSDIENIQFEDICDAVNNNDPLCCEIIENAAYYTGIGISNLINILHPELLILSGPTYRNMNLFYDRVVEVATRRSKELYPTHNIKFSSGKLGENAIAIGAGRMILSHYVD